MKSETLWTIGCALSLTGLLSGPLRAATITWDANGGVGGDWHTGLNWSGTPDNTVPTELDAVEINNAARSSPSNPVVLSNAPAHVASLRIGYSLASTAGYMAISTNLTVTGTFSSYRGSMGVVHTEGAVTANSVSFGDRATPLSKYEISGSAALVVATTCKLARGDTGSRVEFHQDGGTVSTGVDLVMSADGGAGNGGSSLYEMTAGELSVGGVLRIGWKTANASFVQTGGSTIVGGSVVVGTDSTSTNNLLAIAEDAVLTGQGLMAVGSSSGGEGTLLLDGSRTGAGSNVSVATTLSFGAKGVLAVNIDADATLASTAQRKVHAAGNVSFAAGAKVLPKFAMGVTPTAGSWTVCTWGGGVTNNGLALHPSVDPELWSFSIAGAALTVTYTPPSPAGTLITIR